MDWLFYALLASAVYAVVVYIDKYILEKVIADYRGMPIYSAIIAPIFGVVIWVGTGFPVLGFFDALIVMLTGVLTIWGLASYFKALSDDEASKVTILFQMTPVMTLILSYLFLQERISTAQLIGFMLILSSTLGISINKKQKRIHISPVFLLILLTDFLWASAFVLFKFVVDSNSFAKVISYETFGIGLGGLILYYLFPSVRKAFHSVNKKMRGRILIFIVINETFFLISRLLTYLAISKGSVALVDVVAGTQVFFAIVYGWLLTTFYPKIFKEDISKEGLYKKIVMGGLVLFGLWLINI